jgi:redox-sensing transcriptional repressor
MAHKIPHVPEATVARLTTYLRCLEQLEAQGVKTVCSRTIARLAGTNDAQFRKDLSYFGGIGTRGRGYSVERLQEHLRHILNLHRPRHLILIGVGNLGQALLGFPGFHRSPFHIVAAFDNDAKKVGTTVHGVRVRHIRSLARFVRSHPVHIAILAVPAAVAQSIADLVVRAGIPAILNFAPIHLQLPPEILVRQVDLTRELEVLSYVLGAER